MRTVWKGAVSFGLVTIPVKLYAATEERDVSFHQVHATDGARIRYKRVCAADGQEVAFAEIAKGYELATGEMVVLTDDDFAALPLSTQRAVEVLGFVPLDQIDPVYFDRSYVLEPEPLGLKPYVLLRQALEETGRVGLVKVALRQRERLACLRVREDLLVLETMLWPDEIRSVHFDVLDEEVTPRAAEVAMATTLIGALAVDFDPAAYTDAYRAALQELIDAKVAGDEVVTPPSAEDGEDTAVVDLMAALRASVEAAQAARTDSDRPSAGSAAAAPSGRQGAKRASA